MFAEACFGVVKLWNLDLSLSLFGLVGGLLAANVHWKVLQTVEATGRSVLEWKIGREKDFNFERIGSSNGQGFQWPSFLIFRILEDGFTGSTLVFDLQVFQVFH